MEDITDYFKELLAQHHSIDIAESEFKRMIAEDDELKDRYRQWCDENGSTEKRGFFDYCEEYMDSQDSIWESLNDYDE